MDLLKSDSNLSFTNKGGIIGIFSANIEDLQIRPVCFRAVLDY